MYKLLVFLLPLVLIWSCTDASADENTVASVQDVKKMEGITNSSLITNPISADEVIQPEDAAQLVFEEEVFDFGDITEGDKVEHVFKFTNTGKNPLVISKATGSCGCTVPEWPREPIAPGQSGEMKVSFNSKGKQGEQDKRVTIQANTIPNKTIIRVVGNVNTNPDTEAAELKAKAEREAAE